MTELILGGILLVVLGGFGWYVREEERFKSKLINAILAKDSVEYLDRNFADTLESKKETKDKPPELVLEQDLTDEDFSRHIEKINEKDTN